MRQRWRERGRDRERVAERTMSETVSWPIILGYNVPERSFG